ncbi:MAG: menaquinone biosynthesis protein [Planctomycetes bacterium]|nr:menaquinone biosynthesis protein [Planctomycetota bacterium]
MIRAGYIDYLNSLAFTEDIRLRPIEGVEAVIATPAKLNERMALGELALSAVSAYAYLENSERYLLAPGLSINSKRHVHSVKLFLRRSRWELSCKKIRVTPESATSVNLLRIILNWWRAPEVSLSVFDGESDMLDGDGVLLIGDRALGFDSHDYPYAYDLAEIWTERMRMPLVFAVWVVRRDLNGDPLVEKVLRRLWQVRDGIGANIDRLALKAAELHRGKPLDFRTYYRALDFNLDGKGLESLRAYARELKGLADLPPLISPSFFRLQRND